ncbi:MAG: DNA-directed RNA polymerase subunit beta' [Bacilli bacterium]|nr:DNA-directed RNA polymerase subunit beta' [Bacilli bacterium]
MRKYKYMKIGIASPEEIVSWANPELQGKEFKYDPKRKDKVTYIDDNGDSKELVLRGEVKKHETLNYRTQKPEREGLFCEVIFGPTKDNQCACGKTARKIVGEHRICEKCGVELTSSKVRRERMGYIALAAPVVHTWYLRNTPSKIAILLDMKTKEVEEIVYLASYIVIEVNDDIDELYPGQILTEQENAVFKRRYYGRYKATTGAETIKYLLSNLNLKQIMEEIRLELKTATKQKKEKLIKRLEIVEAFLQSTNKPEWMVMDVIPVIPPDLRPMVLLEGGRFATTDLNELYRRIINRNTRLRKLFELGAPDLITKNEKRLLQEAVDALIDNSKRNKKVAQEKNRPLKSLSDILRGKQGRFRQNLLGKRVDYSGRSVICVGPFLKMYQCGIPREMALILFKPFIISYLRKNQIIDENAVDSNGLPISAASREKAGIKRAKELIEKGAPEAMDALEKIVVEHPVLLNRAPTLHRLSIQAFEPVLVEGKAIRLHPLSTTAFNADFDGDQMPVHVPLSEEAQAEARMLMLASKNILAPKDGKPVVTPSQDMIIGNYYLTIERSQPDRTYHTFEELYKAYEYRVFEFDNQIIVNDEQVYRDIEALREDVKAGITPSVGTFLVVGREGKAFKDISEVEHAYERHEIDFHTRFVMPGRAIDKPFVNLDPADPKYEEKVKLNEELKDMFIVTTYGKLIFNQVFPEHFVFFNEPDPKKALTNLRNGTPEYFFIKRGTNYKEAIAKMPLGQPAKKKTLSVIISEVFRQCKLAETSLTLDKMKDLGFYYSTISGVTISVFDVRILEKKYQLIAEADEQVKKYTKMYRRGIMLDSERKRNVIRIWEDTKKEIEKEIKKVMEDEASINDIFLMADSGARGSSSNFIQLAGMRGLMAKPNGESMEIPVKACFKEGMSMSDFFISTHGARKGSTDTALKTAESGYLTRRLVDVSQDITITTEDCGTDKGLVMTTLYKKNEKDPTFDPVNDMLVSLKDRIVGRFAAKPVYGKVGSKKVLLVNKGGLIDGDIADQIVKAGVKEVEVRTNLTCNCAVGVCVKCYGTDLSTNGLVEKGEVVGIVAAQSIGEPGTQLTMRTFHSGGVASGSDDITQGLPRVQELFEARAPKGQGIISEIKGTVESVTLVKDSRYEIKIHSDIPNNDKVYLTDAGKKAIVSEGESVEAGDLISEGAVNIKELLRVSSVDKVEKYILKEIQKSYRTAAAVEISDKHVEIIVKQMLQKVVVIDSGETELLPGTLISKPELYRVFKDCCEKGLRIPAVKPVVLGITRASLKSDSFLAAASFQETTRVLTEAAIRGKVDNLEGLKENIIIGGLIPAGTGLVEEVGITVNEENEQFDIKKL